MMKKILTKNYKNLKSKIFFRTKFFFLGLCRFSAKIDKIVKKCHSQKFLVEIFLVGSDSVRMFQNVFQIENFEIEKFSRVTFFLGLSYFLPKLGANSSQPSFVPV